MSAALVRRIAGGVVMAMGGGCALFFLAVGALITANYVEWPNWREALTTILLLTLPGFGLGCVLVALGRALYAPLQGHRPLLGAAPWLTRVVGGAIALLMGLLLINVFLRGYGPQDFPAAARLAAGIGVGLLMVGLSGKWSRARQG